MKSNKSATTPFKRTILVILALIGFGHPGFAQAKDASTVCEEQLITASSRIDATIARLNTYYARGLHHFAGAEVSVTAKKIDAEIVNFLADETDQAHDADRSLRSVETEYAIATLMRSGLYGTYGLISDADRLHVARSMIDGVPWISREKAHSLKEILKQKFLTK